jgi:negative regulator of sigma E activity
MEDQDMNEKNSGSQHPEDRVLEWYSAHLDGEVEELSEFERHQLLKLVEGGAVSKMEKLSLASHVMQLADRSGECVFPVGGSILEAVRKGVENEKANVTPLKADHNNGTGKNTGVVSAWLRPFGQVAIAASIAVAVVLGLQHSGVEHSGNITTPLAENNRSGEVSADGSVTRVIMDSSLVSVSDGQQSDVSSPGGLSQHTVNRINSAQLKSLREQRNRLYLMYHLEHASLNNSSGMLPFARVSYLEESQP